MTEKVKKIKSGKKSKGKFKSARKKKKKVSIIYKLTAILSVVIIFICCMIVRYTGMINIEETSARNLISLSDSLISSYDVKNILIIGTDGRTSSDEGRSDTIILLSINEHSREITMTSVMRDIYAYIPNYGYDKINAAYSYGGAELVMDTFEENFGIKVDEYISLNFTAFAGIVDAVGGIEITLSDAEAQEVNNILKNEVNELMGDEKESDFLDGGGTYRLNGKQALCYSRIRYVGDADFERTMRQRNVLSEIISEAKTINPVKLDKFLSKALPQLTTNISKSSLYLYFIKSPMYMLTYDVKQMRIPVDGSWSYADIDGSSVISLDFNDNILVLAKELYKIEYNEEG